MESDNADGISPEQVCRAPKLSHNSFIDQPSQAARMLFQKVDLFLREVDGRAPFLKMSFVLQDFLVWIKKTRPVFNQVLLINCQWRGSFFGYLISLNCLNCWNCQWRGSLLVILESWTCMFDKLECYTWSRGRASCWEILACKSWFPRAHRCMSTGGSEMFIKMSLKFPSEIGNQFLGGWKKRICDTHNQLGFNFSRLLVVVWHNAPHKVGLAVVQLEELEHFQNVQRQNWSIGTLSSQVPPTHSPEPSTPWGRGGRPRRPSFRLPSSSSFLPLLPVQIAIEIEGKITWKNDWGLNNTMRHIEEKANFMSYHWRLAWVVFPSWQMS